ncbi:unnamed protein product [Cyprideis torosa]|uniref:Uncharacterized protein n=1 Tax=Cyprideis torosa TaxID=163714 RepID=A0A7R8ZP45_9CRUS|nr:unnamed protein product [Cyprideis torosa]CAG0889037.1 unnamed protein product [Cyprideis torosa]
MSTPLRRSNVSRVVAESESSGYNSPVAGTPRKLPRQLDLDLEELDDVEFHLPPVEEPTLDSILNEADDEDELLSVDSSGDGGAVGPTVGVSAVQEEGGPDSCLLEQQPLFSPVDSEAQSVVSGGSGSQTSSIRTSRLARREALRREHGSVFRHVILKGISAQVTSASERAGAGLPSAIAAASFLAVGMSNGTVLLFDPGQVKKGVSSGFLPLFDCVNQAIDDVLRAVLGTAKEGEDLGMVSSLAFNVDSTRLLVGHVKGVLRMFDVISGKLLRTIVDAHLPGTAVIHVKFTDSPALALICDSSGSVFELSFKRRLGIRGYDYRCIFSGSRGEVVNIEPLLLSSTPPSHQEDLPPDLDGSLSLVAMASMTKVLVVSIRPELEVLFSQSLPGDQGLLPLLSWRFVLIQSRVKVVDPVLAFGRQDVIYFYQVTVCSSPYPDFIPLQAVPLPFATIGFSWLNNRTLAVLDSKELLHVVDIRKSSLRRIVPDYARLVPEKRERARELERAGREALVCMHAYA